MLIQVSSLHEQNDLFYLTFCDFIKNICVKKGCLNISSLITGGEGGQSFDIPLPASKTLKKVVLVTWDMSNLSPLVPYKWTCAHESLSRASPSERRRQSR